MNRSGKILILLAMSVVIGLPFVLQRDRTEPLGAEERIVIITPHNESIRQEFARGFEDWYRERTGRTVYVDFRVIGGTSEIGKFLASEYLNSFRNYWEDERGREWSREVQAAFSDDDIVLDDTPEDDTPGQAARRAFLNSEVSCGIDLFFGGGSYDFSVQAAKGTLIDAGLLESHPEWFQETAVPGELPESIPETLAGERYYDAEGRWYGAVLSSYGIIYNRDALHKLGFEQEPRQWADLADPRLFGQVAVCDPTKSGSMTQAFEMILQQQMQRLRAGEGASLAEGWMKGMRLIQRIAANARYFTDNSQKPNIDVGMGDCAAGMSIDFYGRFQQENILERSGDNRFGFHTPKGGSTISVDPVGVLRGAPHRKVAQAFLEFVLSLEGQKLWNFEVESPGGPEVYALRRPPIRPELYSDKWNQYRSDADFNPYEAARDFTYHREWTGRLFSELRTIIRICFIDVRKELVLAWEAILNAREEGRTEAAEAALAVFQDLDRISYEAAQREIDAALSGPRIEEVRLARKLSSHFREQYMRTKALAEGRLN